MTAFIESFATQQLLPPWRADGVRTWGFLFPLPAPTIQAYLDRFFNIAHPNRPPFRFSALPHDQYGILAVSQFPSIASINKPNMLRYGPGITSWDHLSHTEIQVAVPVLRETITPDNLIVGSQIDWIQPLAISNNSSVVFGSREIVGVDMIYGRIELDADPGAPLGHVDVFIQGIERFSPTSREAELPFLHVEAKIGSDPRDSNDAVLQRLLKMLGASDSVSTARPPATRLVTLKQFRDAYDQRLASYQAIVQSTTRRDNLRDLQYFDLAATEVTFMWSDTTAQILGTFLALGEPGPGQPPTPHPGAMWRLGRLGVKPSVAFAFTNDVTFEVDGTLHTFGP